MPLKHTERIDEVVKRKYKYGYRVKSRTRRIQLDKPEKGQKTLC